MNFKLLFTSSYYKTLPRIVFFIPMAYTEFLARRKRKSTENTVILKARM